jgi:UV DNA damage endonuclease
MTNYGYCCINLQLSEKKITTNRGMIKKTFQKKGLKYASELALLNVRDLIEIIKWNHKNGINLYRMSSDIFPWMSEYEIKDLPDYRKISTLLRGAGLLAAKYNQRITFHPGHFSVLASKSQSTVDKTIKDLNQHGEIMDLMGLPKSTYAAINIHVNTTQGGKQESLNRFINNFKLLSESVQKRLVVENDDKASQYTVEDLYDGLYAHTNIPITFDYHHHWCHPGGLDQESALKLAAKTWHRSIKQLCHYSSAKCVHEDATVINRAHADYIYDQINDYGLDLDIEIEAKAKEKAVQRYLKQYDVVLV